MIKKVVISGIIVSSLEWYDYSLYGILATAISKLFFPATNYNSSLIATFAIFAAGFVMRPLGALAFGFIGDRYGRRISLVSSVLLMAIPTACIGFLPTYQQIGIGAPVLLAILRLLQGFSLGGATSGSMTFIVEHAPAHRRGLMGSTMMMSMVIGTLLAAAVASIVSYLCTAEQFDIFGWRIPFLFGIIAGIAATYIRSNVDESPIYHRAKTAGTLSARPFADVFRHHLAELLQAMGIILSLTIPYYIITVFLISLLEMLGHSENETLLMNTISMIVLLGFIPLSAMLSDRIGRKSILMGGAILYIITTIPAFWLLCMPGFIPALTGYIVLAALLGCYIGVLPTVLIEIFPTRIRHTGVSFSYNLCISVFGGTAPLVSAALVDAIKEHPAMAAMTTRMLGNINAFPALYITLAAVVTLVTLCFYRERYKSSLE